MGREGVRLPSVALLVTDDVVSETFGGTLLQGQTDNGGGPAQELVQDVVVDAFLIDIEGTGHTEDRRVHVDFALSAERPRDLGGRPLTVETETEFAVPAEELGESQTDSTDLTPTPKRPICPPRLRDTLMRRIVSAPSGVTGVPSFAQ